ncbi:hypothetical protein GCM10011490_11520 [Pseudoclavibacter endophyticus]|uniref:Uncharacterized protein n=1 Tax=Pseudoclavibacter endophyticus TaxID=1778590 RepID=A0A6H9WJQ2_9MICO|nr:hypothetical protein [Pseudoclavibacter endophyticus]KAB1649423.1 hypothetical protein F8O04_03930 [Pseudoclavibacter endophyticus]GGA62754.1 hypothetical protein GCM10011490_11520 [Pseudoclavibacter endophyticus]
MSSRGRRAGRAGAALLLALGAAAGVSGCAQNAGCAPGDAIAAPQGARTTTIAQGTVGVLDGVRIGFANSGCSSGPWRARLTIVLGSGDARDAVLEVGSGEPLEDGRRVVLLSASDDGGWVDIALVAAPSTG